MGEEPCQTSRILGHMSFCYISIGCSIQINFCPKSFNSQISVFTYFDNWSVRFTLLTDPDLVSGWITKIFGRETRGKTFFTPFIFVSFIVSAWNNIFCDQSTQEISAFLLYYIFGFYSVNFSSASYPFVLGFCEKDIILKMDTGSCHRKYSLSFPPFQNNSLVM